jgi:hypothetical protein
MGNFSGFLDARLQTLRVRDSYRAIADLECRAAWAGQTSEADLDNRSCRASRQPSLLVRSGRQSMIIRMGVVASLLLLAGCAGPSSRGEASVCASGRGKGVLGLTCERSASVAPSESGSLTSKP